MSDTPREGIDDHLRDGMEHLQAAALELIEAARAFLDVAEDVVKDPGAVVDLATVIALLAHGAAGSRPSRRSGDGSERRVERIRIV